MDQGKIVQKEEVYYGSNVYFPRLKMKDHAFFGWLQKDGNAPGFYDSKIWDTYEDIVLHAEWVYNSAEAYLNGIKQVGTYCSTEELLEADSEVIETLNNTIKTTVLENERLANEKNTSLIFLHDTEGYGRTQIYKYYSQEMRRPPYDAPMYSIYIKNGQYSDRKTVYDVNLQQGDIIFMRVEFDIRNTGNISDSQLSMERFKTLYNVFLRK